MRRAAIEVVAVAIVVAPSLRCRFESITNVIEIAVALSSKMQRWRSPDRGAHGGCERLSGRAHDARAERANTRERLLAAARSVFARSGFHGASVEEIASEAGFSTGALYSNFDGKEDLFLVLMEREIDEHAREIATRCGRARRSPSGPPAARGSG